MITTNKDGLLKLRLPVVELRTAHDVLDAVSRHAQICKNGIEDFRLEDEDDIAELQAQTLIMHAAMFYAGQTAKGSPRDFAGFMYEIGLIAADIYLEKGPHATSAQT